MVTTTPVDPTSSASPGATAKAVSESMAQKMSSDFETFLKMLTVQMKNQDPLNPTDSADYAVQLATFSGVEQQVKTNDLLNSMVSGLSSDGLGQLAGWIGKEVPAATAVPFTGEALTLMPSAEDKADRVRVEVYAADGTLVETLKPSLNQATVVWPGKAPDGSTLPKGNYSFKTLSYAESSLLSKKDTPVYQPITEVRSGPDGGTLVLAGGRSIAAKEAVALRTAAPSP